MKITINDQQFDVHTAIENDAFWVKIYVDKRYLFSLDTALETLADMKHQGVAAHVEQKLTELAISTFRTAIEQGTLSV